MVKTITSWVNIVLGCTVMATGFVFFINPYNIVPGGVYGASIVLHNLFPSVQVGTFGYCFDIPLLILSVVLLGAKLGIRTIVAALLTPLIMNGLSLVSYPDREALEMLDPTQLLGGIINLSDQLMLASLIGAILIGIGVGLVARNQATTGGSDIVAMILQKYTHLPFSKGILLVDAIVVLFGLVVIGFGLGSAKDAGEPSIHLSLYSLIAIYITSRVVAFMVSGSKDDKLMFVISEKRLVDLQDYILNDLSRSGTYIKSSGMYSGEDKEMLFLVVSYKEAASLKFKIKEFDPRAFVVITDAYDAYGEGWKDLPSASDITPE